MSVNYKKQLKMTFKTRSLEMVFLGLINSLISFYFLPYCALQGLLGLFPSPQMMAVTVQAPHGDRTMSINRRLFLSEYHFLRWWKSLF